MTGVNKEREANLKSSNEPQNEPDLVAAFLSTPNARQSDSTRQIKTLELRRTVEGWKARARGDHPNGAQSFRNLQLQDEFGTIPADGLQKARKQVDRMRSRQQKKASAAGEPEGQEIAGITPGQWMWLGPGNIRREGLPVRS